jgi:uncharacterized phiE125 gp8 family phage protein
MLGFAPISIKRTVDSTTEPISLEEAKDHLRVVDFDEDDDYIAGLITTARHAVERATRRSLWTGQTWEAGYARWARRLSIPVPPLVAVSVVTYYDSDNVLHTVSSTDYVVDASGSQRAVLGFTSDFGVPAHSDDYLAPVRVAFTAGYADADAMPEGLRRAMFYLIQHFYDNRSPVGINVNLNKMPYTFEFLLNQYTVPNRV